ncbi:hypothetical protein COT30_00405 [Candidatus Micrarchaeota archaeon CG08_land_8_20_14_0_20_49_17]|nr:MAG: hypothetical protein COT30_00405 [Candidatus Micrarchaeota archaeon CG08_land_8_20_14_0_20_49_17]PIU82533.1 MAG: hypothetical protein COS70_00815 [Candidatus Micrarchaeota archaeon CG06_land_8_20_14_3_00_50_6]
MGEMLNHRLLFAIALLTLIAITPLLASLNAKSIEEMTIVCEHQGTISAGGPTFKDLEINISIARDDSLQKASLTGATATASSYGRSAYIREYAPGNPYSYSFQETIKSKSTDMLTAQFSQLDASERTLYTKPSELVESGSLFQGIAGKVANNSNSDFERVAKLMIWVHNRTRYDLSVGGQEKSAVWVYNNRKGVCVEFANLFMALTRSIGIPTRYVTGITYSDLMGNWQGHAWAETYIGGKWAAADPTWLELGSVDATHIRYFEGPETEWNGYGSMFVYVRPGSEINWGRTGNEMSSTVSEVQVIASSERLPVKDYELTISTSELSAGEKALITFSYTPKTYGVEKLVLAPCKDMDGRTLLYMNGGQERYLIMEPGVKVQASWVVTASNLLERGYYYICPLMLNSAYFSEKELQVTVNPKPGTNTLIMTGLESAAAPIVIQNGSEYALTAKLVGSADTLTIAANQYYYTGRASPIMAKAIKFDRLGTGTIYLATEDGSVSEIPYIVVGGNVTAPNVTSTIPIPNATVKNNTTINETPGAGTPNTTIEPKPPSMLPQSQENPNPETHRPEGESYSPAGEFKNPEPETQKTGMCFVVYVMVGMIPVYFFSSPKSQKLI